MDVDIIRTIKDPEEPGTLGELNMVSEDLISIRSNHRSSLKLLEDPESGVPTLTIVWGPENFDCKCAYTIALCIRTKLF